MITPISFSILGDPKSQKRHRTYTRGKGGRMLPFAKQVDPSKGDKADFIAQARQHAPESPLEGPLQLRVIFFFPRPKGHYGTGKNAGKLKGSAPMYHTSKPDCDNCVKLVKDAMSGVFYRDDAQVCTLIARKVYADGQPHTAVSLRNP